MNGLLTTTVISEKGRYFESAKAFFSNFAEGYDLARSQILKVETRQSYQEPGNPSYEAMRDGSWDEARRLLPEARDVDKPLYASLRQRGIDFMRCRPVSFPLSDYMKWEFDVYEYNAKHCERIFCCNLEAVKELFAENIHHDFMAFDARMAFIHDYDENGLIRGGWRIEEQSAILVLQTLFVFLKSFCQPYEQYRP